MKHTGAIPSNVLPHEVTLRAGASANRQCLSRGASVFAVARHQLTQARIRPLPSKPRRASRVLAVAVKTLSDRGDDGGPASAEGKRGGDWARGSELDHAIALLRLRHMSTSSSEERKQPRRDFASPNMPQAGD